MTTEFYSGLDWESSSGPIISRLFDEDDLWPHGAGSEAGGGNKDVLEDGLHPVLAIGPKALRPLNLVGSVITYANDLVNVNVAPGHAVKAYVANVLTYDGGNPATFDQSLAIGEMVYVDDSDPLAAGVTLSRSPLNSAGNGNPVAGILWYDQDEMVDSPFGGPNTAAVWPKVVANELTYTLVTVLICHVS
jgi:hypothetical protein